MSTTFLGQHEVLVRGSLDHISNRWIYTTGYIKMDGWMDR
jgi:hypothetical protein